MGIRQEQITNEEPRESQMGKDNGSESAENSRFAFSEVAHTADYALRIRGRNFKSLFQNAARGLYSLMGPSEDKMGERCVEKKITLVARDAEELLVEWLSELAYWVENEFFIGSDIRFSQIDENHIEATISGWKAERVEKLIKAVTWHNLEIRQTGEGFEATVVFDV